MKQTQTTRVPLICVTAAVLLSDLYTVPASLAGLPGISVPCGIHSNGRPLGFQLLGETFSEARLLGVAAAWQRETDWHLRRPAGY